MELSKFKVIFLYFFRNYFRSRSFYFLLSLILFISAVMSYASFRYVDEIGSFITKSSSLNTELKERFFEYFWEIFVPYITLFASVLFGAGAISGELEEGSANFTFSLPLSRYYIYLGKFMSAFVAVSAIVSVYYFFQFVSYTIIFLEFPSYLTLVSFSMELMFSLAILSIVFLFSSLFSRTMFAYLSVMILYFVILLAASLVSEIFYGTDPLYLINNISGILSTVYVGLNFSFLGLSGNLQPAGLPQIEYAVLVMASYLVACSAAAMLIFERRQSY